MYYIECVFYKIINIIAVLINIKRINIINSDLQYFFTIKKLKRKGVKIGVNSLIYNCTFSSSSKGDRFFIGDNCTLTGVVLLGHDASPTLFMKELQLNSKLWQPASRLSYRNPIIIGDNVFIGYGTIIMPGVNIGSNIVIGAGSVITKNIENNVVVAGNPAKVIKSIDSYIAKYEKIYQDNPDSF